MDLLNHQFEDEARTTGTEAWRESYVWRASRHFAAGDEVLWSYGPKPSSAMLLSSLSCRLTEMSAGDTYDGAAL